MERYRSEKSAIEADRRDLERLCASLRAGGAIPTEGAPARVLKALAESGVFHVGGVLVGTHAVAVLGNLLGVRWLGALRTQDIDIAAERDVTVAVPDLKADVPKALDSLRMGFLPVPPLDPKNPSTAFKVRGSSLRVDLLTPQRGPGPAAPVFIARLRAAAQPVAHMDFLIEEAVRGAVVDGGGVLVRVPAPARFAFQKLYTAKSRPATEQAKSGKDLLQAAQVFAAVTELRPGDLLLAWDALKKRSGLLRGVRVGLKDLEARYPEVHRGVAAALR
jgi:hypothetical protein